MTDMEKVEISKELLFRILDKLYFTTDEGPAQEGWHSNELMAVIGEVEEILEIPMDKRFWKPGE